jgi:two-component system cell cycle sensor histidine kinase/response regulator CckA
MGDFGRDVTDRKNLESQLGRARQEWKEIFEAVGHPMMILDTEHRILEVNPATTRVAGLSREELIGRRCFEVFHHPGDAGPPGGCPLQTILREGESQTTEMEMEAVMGTFLVSCTPMYDEFGRVEKIIHVATDITGRKATEKALAQSEERYRNLVEDSPEGVVLHDGEMFLYLNPRAVALYGADNPGDLIGKRVLDYVHPDDRDPVGGRIGKILSTGGSTVPWEVRILRVDGQSVSVETSGGLVDYRGRKVVQVILRDVAERKKTEEALRFSERKYRELYEGMRDGWAAVDMTGRITEFNSTFQHMVGYEETEVHGLAYEDLTPPNWHSFEKRILEEQVLKRGYSDPYEKEYRRKDGVVFPVELTAYLLRDHKGRPSGFWAVVRDITERKEAERVIQASEKKYRSIFEQALEGIFQTTPEGRYLSVNPALARTFGYPSPQSMMDEVSNIGEQQYVRPEDREKIKKLYEQQGFIDDFEVEMYTRDRRPIWVSMTARAVRDEEGRILFYEGVTEDVTKRKLAEEALKVSEETFYKAFQLSPLMKSISTLKEGRYIDVNRAFLETTGYTREEAVGQTSTDLRIFANPEDRDRFVLLLTRDGLLRNEEADIRTKDGRVRTTSFSAEIIEVRGEQHLLVIADDITDRKRAVEALRESEATLRTLFRAAPIGIGFVKDRILGWTNEEITRMTGYSPEELEGESAMILYPDEEEFLKVGMVKHAKVKEEGIGSIETRWRRKDGTVLDVFLSSASIVPRDLSSGLVFTAMDISERKGFEAQLSESEERYRTAIENSNDGIAVVRGDAYLYVNRRFVEMFGYERSDEVVGRSMAEFVHPEDHDRVIGINLRRQRNEEVPSRYEFKGVRKDGSVIFVEVSAARTNYFGMSVSIAYLRDISERKDLEAQLVQAQKMEAVGQLAGGVAHDFNNLLTTIIGYSSLLQMKMAADDPLRVYVDPILTSGERGAHLTQSLLAFSRKQILNQKPIDLNDTVKGARRLLARVIGEDVTLETEYAKEDLTVMADSVQIEQILMNLAINARDAMPQGGTLGISTGSREIGEEQAKRYNIQGPGRFACITVSDTGAGMDDKTKERIFEPFFTTKEVGKGTGLGLSIVYGIVKQHGGYVEVMSEPTRGTTFEIYLPLIRHQLWVPEEEERGLPPGGTETVLLAEDEPAVRQLSKQLLEDAGYHVIEAFDGEDAVRKFLDNRDGIDLLVLDVVMPKMNGKEVLNTVRGAGAGVRTLFVSGYSEDIIHTKGILQEGLDFVAKPIMPWKFLLKVREALDR